MKTNPGGEIAPTDVIGRAGLIQNLWRILERQSVVLAAERRMGKTCVLKKMKAEAPKEKLPLYRDLEGIRTPLEFAETIFRDVEAYLSSRRKFAQKARQLWTNLSGAEIGGLIKFPETLAPHWKDLLTKTIEDLVEQQDHTVILFWDEMPLMLYNIKKQQNGEAQAMEVLDTLRALRQMHQKLRMVFTGSIGLHNVITSLKRAGYANMPTNDMSLVEMPPLASQDARDLAHALLHGEGLTGELDATARAIATDVDGIPYYIHHVVDEMVKRGSVANLQTVKDIVNTCLTTDLDPWHLRYYRERFDTYYEAANLPYALNLLDELAVAEEPLTFDVLFNGLKSRIATEDSETVRHVLRLLQQDHYVAKETDGRLCFRFSLIQRWWRLDRGLPL